MIWRCWECDAPHAGVGLCRWCHTATTPYLQKDGAVSKDQRFGYRKNLDKKVWEQWDMQTRAKVGEVPMPEETGKKVVIYKENGGALIHVPKEAGGKKKEGKEGKFEKADNAWARECLHKGVNPVWTYGGRAFFAAGYGGIRPWEYDLVIDLADLAPKQKAQKLVKCEDRRYEALNKFMPAEQEKVTPVLKLAWEDQKALPVGIKFWEALWKLLPTGTEEAPARILVNCFGSHGRTGTALSCLMLASGDERIWSPAVAIMTVRANHCEKAIESQKQVAYLNELAAELELEQDAEETNTIMDSKEGLKQWAEEAEKEPVVAPPVAAKKGKK
jgi:hypothetical protein